MRVCVPSTLEEQHGQLCFVFLQILNNRTYVVVSSLYPNLLGSPAVRLPPRPFRLGPKGSASPEKARFKGDVNVPGVDVNGVTGAGSARGRNASRRGPEGFAAKLA